MAGEAQGRGGPGCGGQGGRPVGRQPPAPQLLAKLQEPPGTFFSGSPNSRPPPPAWEGGAGPIREEGGRPRMGQRLELLLPGAAQASPTTWPRVVILGRVVSQLPSAA